jgi:hypothetical protein
MFRNKMCMFLCSIVLYSAQAASVHAQGRSAEEVDFLAQRILAQIPDIPNTAFGRGSERLPRARVHAAAILQAADSQASRWDDFARRSGWTTFDAHRDLPALIGAIALRESAFKSVIRLNDGSHVYQLPVISQREGSRLVHRTPVSDIGVMQVRAPSRTASVCGVTGRDQANRLLTDMVFSYAVGACVLTNHVERYVDTYADSHNHHLRSGQRSPSDLQFFGVIGARSGTFVATRARELLVIERYNWGGNDLYLHPTHGGYARRVLSTMEQFSQPFEQEIPGG